MATVAAFQVRHAVPRTGSLVPVDTGDAGSGFKHRGELVYLPPAWFASDPPPRLPTVMMNGGRGMVADHLVNDVVPAMVSKFGVSPDPANWGVVGWSMGGTCAVDLTVMHPDRFSAFEDIAGDLSP